MTGLLEKEKKALTWILPSSYALFLFGVALALFVALPAALRFLLAYGSAELLPMLTAEAYFQFAFYVALAFGLLFQMPLLLIFLCQIGLVTQAQLAAWRRHVYLGAFIVAGVLTPGPDVFSQAILAAVTVVLFEASLLVARWTLPQSIKPRILS